MSRRPFRWGVAWRSWALALLIAAVVAQAAVPSAQAATKSISYDGFALRIPAGWPVFDLGRDPGTCVRFNRHAVYLGIPSADQACPAHAFGRTEAILIAPASAHAVLPLAPGAAELHRGQVTITVTWNRRLALMQRLLHARALGHGAPIVTSAPDGPTARVAKATQPVASAAAAVYTGPGFDSCEDPSTKQLTAWLASTYRAVGTYIGGANMGCSQPNLSASYVSEEVAAGWNLIPTYVGLQAPTNSCGCHAINPKQATAQGTAAAEDAVSDAQAVGIGTGNPIYDDMEAYPPGSKNTPTVMAFLSAWTTELHALGYQSGVYSSTDSGIHDLVAAASSPGNTYALPDDLWNAEWNGEQSTSDAAIPSTEWSSHQRLHQNQGAHNETYDHVRMNVDGDYIDGATVGDGSVAPPAASPTLSIAPAADGSISLNGSWSSGVGVAGWRLLGGDSPTALTPITGALASGQIVSHSALAYFSEEALGSDGQVLASSPVTATPSHIVVYGHTVFAPAAGWAGLPVGCFTPSPCSIATTITAGHTVVASSRPERVGAGSSGIVYVTLTAAGRKLLSATRDDRLPVTVTAADGAGPTATVAMTMILYATSGPAPARSGVPGSAVKLVGYTDFVGTSGTGGVLGECTSVVPCSVSTAIVSGATVLAVTGPEFLGANELGYLSFRLTAAGRALMARATGSQLAASVKLDDGTAGSATASIALVRYR